MNGRDRFRFPRAVPGEPGRGPGRYSAPMLSISGDRLVVTRDVPVKLPGTTVGSEGGHPGSSR